MSRPRWMYGVEGQTPGARLLLALLWSWADLGARTAFVWPSVATLTEMLGQTERSTRRQLESLTKAKLIRREKRQQEHGETLGWVLSTPYTVPEATRKRTEASGRAGQDADRGVREHDQTTDPGVTQTGPTRHSNLTETSVIRRSDGAIDGTSNGAMGLASALLNELYYLAPGGCRRHNRIDLDGIAAAIQAVGKDQVLEVAGWVARRIAAGTDKPEAWSMLFAKGGAIFNIRLSEMAAGAPGRSDPDDIPLYTGRGAAS